VGYGDIAPVTWPGRIVNAFLIIVGVMIFLGFMALLATTMFISDKKLVITIKIASLSSLAWVFLIV